VEADAVEEEVGFILICFKNARQSQIYLLIAQAVGPCNFGVDCKVAFVVCFCDVVQRFDV